MIRTLKRLGALVVLALLVPLNASAQEQRFDLTVTADATKTNGSPWDGVPRLGNSRINLNAAPDIAVCLVRANARPECLWKPEGRRLLSMCQNASTCTFSNVALQPQPIGLVFVDIDARNHDIIDLVILGDANNSKPIEEISESLRTAMSVLTPHRSEDTKEHLVRAAKVLPLADCASGKPCRLTQSQFSLVRKP